MIINLPQAAAEEKLQAIIEVAENSVSFDTSRLGSLSETILRDEVTGGIFSFSACAHSSDSQPGDTPGVDPGEGVNHRCVLVFPGTKLSTAPTTPIPLLLSPTTSSNS
jgi:hypothetical protein